MTEPEQDKMATFISSLLWSLKAKDIPLKDFYANYPHKPEYVELVDKLLPEPVEDNDREEFDDIVRQSILIAIETFEYFNGELK